MLEAVASYYEIPGATTACGETMPVLGVANKTLPCGTMIEFCASTCVDAPVIDRGPYVAGRTFDLSETLARAIGFSLSAGVGVVRYRMLG